MGASPSPGRSNVAIPLRKEMPATAVVAGDLTFVARMRHNRNCARLRGRAPSGRHRPGQARRQIRFAPKPVSGMMPRVSAAFQPNNPQRFESALRRFDAENSRDPNNETVNGISHPREKLYAQRLTGWVLRLCPDASEELRLAARCQHLCRWEIPRQAYPMTRAGYLQWRATLKKFHAQKAGDILREAGYPEDAIRRVQDLNLKKLFPDDPETRVLEDALCLVFLEFQLAGLAARTAEEKIINAIQKSWGKMSSAARSEALKLNYGEREKALLQRALNG